MTSKVSNKKSSPVLHNFWCGVKTKTKMAIIIGILHLAAAPAVIISLIAGIYSKEPTSMVEAFLVIGVITTAIAGFMGIFIAIDSFSCLHNKSVVDMRLSLPLTAAQRFFSNFLSGLAVYIVPFLAAQVVSMLGMAYGFIFMEGRTFEEISYYGVSNNQYREYTCDFFGTAMPILLKLIAAGILVMLMLYTVTVLVTVCCGNKFESIAYTILINIMIPQTIYLVFMSMFSELYGIYMSETIARIIMYTSPAGGIMAAVQWAMNEEFFADSNMNYVLWAVMYFILTAAIGAGAFFLYKKRRAEQVSKPFVFKLIYYIISTAAIFCIYSVFYYGRIGFVPAILTTVIVYVILEVVANRGFKKIWLSLIKYAAVMSASVLVIFAAQKTEGFGMVTRVPDISQVKSVSLKYDGYYGYFPIPRDENNNIITLSFSEKENIETIIAAHQGRVDKRDEWSVGIGVEITYELKNGRKLKRTYNNMTAEEAEILGKLDLTDEYKTQVAEIYKNEIIGAVDVYRRIEEYSPEYAASKKTTLTSVCNIIYDNESSVRTGTLVRKNFYEQLAEAYAKDIMNITEENYYLSDAKNIYMLSFDTNIYDLTIPETFGNTLELLKYFGFTVSKKEDISDMDLYEYLTAASGNNRVYIYTAEEWRSSNEIPEYVRLHAQYHYSRRGGSHRVTNIDKDFCDLYRAAEPMNIVPDNGYIIYVFGETAVIPEELNGVAERVYAGISENDDAEYNNENPFWLESTDESIFQEVPIETIEYSIS